MTNFSLGFHTRAGQAPRPHQRVPSDPIFLSCFIGVLAKHPSPGRACDWVGEGCERADGGRVGELASGAVERLGRQTSWRAARVATAEAAAARRATTKSLNWSWAWRSTPRLASGVFSASAGTRVGGRASGRWGSELAAGMTAAVAAQLGATAKSLNWSWAWWLTLRRVFRGTSRAPTEASLRTEARWEWHAWSSAQEGGTRGSADG